MSQTIDYTFDNVPLSEAPLLDPVTTAAVGVDTGLTFQDVPENGGKYKRELPVIGTFARLPVVNEAIQLSTAADLTIIATIDTHARRNNMTLCTAFLNVPEEPLGFWLTADNASQVDLHPEARFNKAVFVEFMQTRPGEVIWPGHGLIDSPLYGFHPSTFRALSSSNRVQYLRKGQDYTKQYPGLALPSYSAARLANGQSLGLAEKLLAMGVTVVVLFGNCGDFCDGETALDLADAGLTVYILVDAQASVKVPNFAGTNLTSEQLMVRRLRANGNIKFTSLANLKMVNAHLLRAS